MCAASAGNPRLSLTFQRINASNSFALAGNASKFSTLTRTTASGIKRPYRPPPLPTAFDIGLRRRGIEDTRLEACHGHPAQPRRCASSPARSNNKLRLDLDDARRQAAARFARDKGWKLLLGTFLIHHPALWPQNHRLERRPRSRGLRLFFIHAGINRRAQKRSSALRGYSTNVTLLISRSVVTPSRTFSRADSRRVTMPSRRATRRSSEVDFRSRISSRIVSVRAISSPIAVRPRKPVWLQREQPAPSYITTSRQAS